MTNKKNSGPERQSWTERNGDFLVIGIISAFITALTYIALAAGPTQQYRGKPFNFGFGPEMDCQPVGLGEPVCVRRR